MNMRQLHYARALAELCSFVQAASQCSVTQPTLSNAIAQLEQDLGHRLFERTTRSVCLTEAGRQLLPDICDLLNAEAALLARARSLSDPQRHLIRVGVSPLVGVKLVDLVIEPFRRENPDLEIVFRELNLAEMVRLLDIGQLDLVFGPIDPGDARKPGHQTALFLEEPLVFIPSSRTRSHYGRAATVSLDDISGETFVMVPDACGLSRTSRSLFTQRGVILREYAGQAMSYGVLQEWADMGIGSAILPRSKLRDGTDDEILISEPNAAPVLISYRSLWRQPEETTGQAARLATFLRDIAPSVVRGLHAIG
jgi:LysR family transcriptional regulator, hydrogen peroxide-inducible genes activator